MMPESPGPAAGPSASARRVRRLDSAASVAEAVGRLGFSSDGRAPDRGLAIGPEARPLLALGLARAHSRSARGLGRAAVVTVAPIVVVPAAPVDAVRAAATAALRELFLVEPEWHVLRLVGAPAAVVDAAWPLATALGYACAVTQEPAPARTADGGAAAGPVVLSVY